MVQKNQRQNSANEAFFFTEHWQNEWLLNECGVCCRNITLLHYIITVLEKKYPRVVAFSEELQNVADAAKVK